VGVGVGFGGLSSFLEVLLEIRMPLVVTGSVGIDTIHTPASSATEVLGGSCTYFAAAASFFHPVRVVAAVGGDFDPRCLEPIRAFPGVDLEGLETRKGSETFRWTGRYHSNMNDRDTLEVDLGVLGEAPPPVPRSFADSQYVFLANAFPRNQMHFLDSFPKRRLAVADTMDLWISTEREALNELLERIDGLVLNDSEAEMMTEISNPVKAAITIREKYNLKFVVLKKGEHGCLLAHEEGLAVLPAYPVESVIDPTRAGDCFAGGMMGYLASINRTDFSSIQQALTHGTVISSFTVEAFSLDRLRQIGIANIHARMIQFAHAVRVV